LSTLLLGSIIYQSTIYITFNADKKISNAHIEMKLILAGASGFIGHEVLSRALTNPKITSLIALSRKPLPELYSSHPKLLTIIHNDFTSYPPSLMTQLAGAEGCIWHVHSFDFTVPFMS